MAPSPSGTRASRSPRNLPGLTPAPFQVAGPIPPPPRRPPQHSGHRPRPVERLARDRAHPSPDVLPGELPLAERLVERGALVLGEVTLVLVRAQVGTQAGRDCLSRRFPDRDGPYLE